MATKTYPTVKVEKKDGIAWVILNRPEKRNAMNPREAARKGSSSS